MIDSHSDTLLNPSDGVLPRTGVVFLDLDRTCFNTDRWLAEVAQNMSSLYGVGSPRSFIAQYKEYCYRSSVNNASNSYYYNLASHIASYGLQPVDVFTQFVQSNMADGHLQCAGLDDLVAWLQQQGYLVRVLTYGDEQTQRFKADLCPALHNVEVTTTLADKIISIRDYTACHREPIWVIDDKSAVGQEIVREFGSLSDRSSTVRFIQVDNTELASDDEAGLNRSSDSVWPICHSLTEVKEYIRAMH